MIFLLLCVQNGPKLGLVTISEKLMPISLSCNEKVADVNHLSSVLKTVQNWLDGNLAKKQGYSLTFR